MAGRSPNLEIGADRILCSTDYPFEEVEEAAEWFDRVPISEPDRLKIGRINSLKLFKMAQETVDGPKPGGQAEARGSRT